MNKKYCLRFIISLLLISQPLHSDPTALFIIAKEAPQGIAALSQLAPHIIAGVKVAAVGATISYAFVTGLLKSIFYDDHKHRNRSKNQSYNNQQSSEYKQQSNQDIHQTNQYEKRTFKQTKETIDDQFSFSMFLKKFFKEPMDKATCTDYALEQEEDSLHALQKKYDEYLEVETDDHETVLKYAARNKELKTILTSRSRFTWFNNQLPEKNIIFLEKHKMDPREFQVFYGNAMQRLLHEDCLQIIEQAASLPIIVDNNLELLHGYTINLFRLGDFYNRWGYVTEACTMIDQCKASLDYLQEASHNPKTKNQTTPTTPNPVSSATLEKFINCFADSFQDTDVPNSTRICTTPFEQSLETILNIGAGFSKNVKKIRTKNKKEWSIKEHVDRKRFIYTGAFIGKQYKKLCTYDQENIPSITDLPQSTRLLFDVTKRIKEQSDMRNGIIVPTGTIFHLNDQSNPPQQIPPGGPGGPGGPGDPEEPPGGPNGNHNNNKPSKGPNKIGRVVPVATASAKELEEIYEKYNNYLCEQVIKCEDAMLKLYGRTKICPTELKFKHIYEAFGRGKKISGYHSTQFINLVQKRIPNTTMKEGYEAVVGTHNGAGRFITDPKTMFPDNYDGYKIVDTFIEVCRNITETVIGSNNSLVVGKSSTGQLFKFVIDKKGIISTFYPSKGT